MPLLYALAPCLLVAAAVLFATSRLGRRLVRGAAPRLAFDRPGRLAMVIAVMAALPLAVLLIEGGDLVSALNAGYVSGMGSDIIR